MRITRGTARIQMDVPARNVLDWRSEGGGTTLTIGWPVGRSLRREIETVWSTAQPDEIGEKITRELDEQKAAEARKLAATEVG